MTITICVTCLNTYNVSLILLKYILRSVQFVLWDTCGQERFRSIGVHFCRGAHAFIFVYDVTNADSFLGLKSWIHEVETMQLYTEAKVKILLGNKSESYR